MTEENNVPVAAPEKWMNGWNSIYTKMLEMSDEELTEIEVSRPIRQLLHALHITKTDPKGLKVLELACGDGSAACYLAKQGCIVEGVEALANAVKVARRKIKILGLEENVTIRLDDIDGWTIEPESYDVISVIQSLQYLFDRTMSRLREILAGIKPGGFFVYSGNILPHFETEPPIRFITEDELEIELNGWTLHCIGGDETLQKPGDLRGYVWTVARKPL
ncbi:MAG: class I SAM-dependent methyltransferase [Candidatus Thorarchaeota archaeon]